MEGYRIQMYPDALGSIMNKSIVVDEGEGKGETKLNGDNDINMELTINDDQNGESEVGSPLPKRAK